MKQPAGGIGRIRGSYVARLGTALLGAVALMLVVGVVVQTATATQVRTDAERNLQFSAEVQANELDQWLEGNERQARSTARMSVMGTDDPERIRAELTALIEEGHVAEEVVGIHYLDTSEGVFLTSTDERFVGVSPAEQGAPFVSTVQEGFDDPDETYVSRPFTVPIADFPIVAIVTPVPGVENRAIVFMINPTAETTELRQPVEGGFTTVVTADGTAVASPSDRSSALSGDRTRQLVSGTGRGESGVVESGGDLVAHAGLETVDWVLLVQAPADRAFALVGSVRRGLVGMFLVGLLGLAVVAATVGRNTAGRLQSLSASARELGDGRLDTEIEAQRSDELGTLAAELATMRDSMRERIRDLEQARREAELRAQDRDMRKHLETKAGEYTDVMDACADGDLTARMDPDSESEAMAAVGESFNAMMDELEAVTDRLKGFADDVAAAAEQVTVSTQEVEGASEQVAESVQEIADGADHQDETLQEIAGEMNALSSTVEEIAASADGVAAVASDSVETGVEARKAAENAIAEMRAVEADSEAAVDAIEGLQGSMAEIEEITEFITDIAEQTNILALNASIEAARAGEAGEGFAVVADEVKSLAEETREAAGDIEDRIERVQAETDEAVDSIQETQDLVADGVDTIEDAIGALEEIADYVDDMDNGVQNISSATADQARSVQTVVSMVEDLSSISEETTEEAETVAASAEQQAATLSTISERAADLTERSDRLWEALRSMETGGAVDDGAGEVATEPTADGGRLSR